MKTLALSESELEIARSAVSVQHDMLTDDICSSSGTDIHFAWMNARVTFIKLGGQINDQWYSTTNVTPTPSTIEFTDVEYDCLKEAVEVHHEIMYDSIEDRLFGGINLFPDPGEYFVIDQYRAQHIRDGIMNAVDEISDIRLLLNKLS